MVEFLVKSLGRDVRDDMVEIAKLSIMALAYRKPQAIVRAVQGDTVGVGAT